MISYEPAQQLTAEQIKFLQRSCRAMDRLWMEIFKDTYFKTNAIIGLSEFMLQIGRFDESTQKDVKSINQYGHFLMAVYNELEAMRQVSFGFIGLNIGPVNVDQLLQEAITDLWQHWLMADWTYRPTIKQNLPNKLPIIQADSLQVQRAITRLFVDLIRATSEEANQIEISVSYDDVWITIEITTEGTVQYDGPILFFDDDSPRIFFARTVTDMHGGKLKLGKRKENELVVALTLPISQTSSAKPRST